MLHSKQHGFDVDASALDAANAVHPVLGFPIAEVARPPCLLRLPPIVHLTLLLLRQGIAWSAEAPHQGVDLEARYLQLS